MQDDVSIQVPEDFRKRLIHFVTDLLNRNVPVRDAVGRGFKAVADSYGDCDMRVTEEVFEKTVAYFEKALEEYRAQQEAGRQAVGGGIYAEIVSDEEYAERAGNSGARSSSS